jgi:hypothetical protein
VTLEYVLSTMDSILPSILAKLEPLRREPPIEHFSLDWQTGERHVRAVTMGDYVEQTVEVTCEEFQATELGAHSVIESDGRIITIVKSTEVRRKGRSMDFCRSEFLVTLDFFDFIA